MIVEKIEYDINFIYHMHSYAENNGPAVNCE